MPKKDEVSVKSTKSVKTAEMTRRKPSPKAAPERKQLSRYMKEIIRIQFVEFIHKYDIYQAKKRAEAIKAVRSHLTRRFMRFYRIFRHKKYGEALEDYTKNDDAKPNFIPFDFENVEYPPEIQKQDDLLKEQFRALEHQYNMSNGEAPQAKNTDLE